MQKKRFNNENGIAMIVVLILLLLITMLGLVGIRSVTQSERMVGASYDRSLAFQAAEAALRQGEEIIEANKPKPTTGCVTSTYDAKTAKVCVVNAAPRWLDATFTEWTDAATVGAGSLIVTPKYFVEYLGNTFPCGLSPTDPPGCLRYRITAKVDGTDRAGVMLQSVYSSD